MRVDILYMSGNESRNFDLVSRKYNINISSYIFPIFKPMKTTEPAVLILLEGTVCSYNKGFDYKKIKQ